MPTDKPASSPLEALSQQFLNELSGLCSKYDARFFPRSNGTALLLSVMIGETWLDFKQLPAEAAPEPALRMENKSMNQAVRGTYECPHCEKDYPHLHPSVEEFLENLTDQEDEELRDISGALNEYKLANAYALFIFRATMRNLRAEVIDEKL